MQNTKPNISAAVSWKYDLMYGDGEYAQNFEVLSFLFRENEIANIVKHIENYEHYLSDDSIYHREKWGMGSMTYFSYYLKYGEHLIPASWVEQYNPNNVVNVFWQKIQNV